MQSSNEEDGQNCSAWFYCQALFSNSSDCFHIWKKYIKIYIFYQYPHSPAACIYEFFLKNVINKNARGIHYYSQLLKKTMISLIVLLFKQSFLTPTPPPPSRGQHIDERPLKNNKARNYKRCLYARFYLILFFYYCLLNNQPVEQQSDPAHTT